MKEISDIESLVEANEELTALSGESSIMPAQMDQLMKLLSGRKGKHHTARNLRAKSRIAKRKKKRS